MKAELMLFELQHQDICATDLKASIQNSANEFLDRSRVWETKNDEEEEGIEEMKMVNASAAQVE